jgi:hypothetical protein
MLRSRSRNCGNKDILRRRGRTGILRVEKNELARAWQVSIGTLRQLLASVRNGWIRGWRGCANALRGLSIAARDRLAHASYSVRRPGWPRRSVIFFFVAATAVCSFMAAFVAAFKGGSLVAGVLIVFFVSLIAFQGVARLTADAEICWRRVDYLWVLTAAGTIIVTTANLELTALKAQMSALTSSRQSMAAQMVGVGTELRQICRKIGHDESQNFTAFLVEAPWRVDRLRVIKEPLDCSGLSQFMDYLDQDVQALPVPESHMHSHFYSDVRHLCEGELALRGVEEEIKERVISDREYATKLRDQLCELAVTIDNEALQLRDSERKAKTVASRLWQPERIESLYWWYFALAFAVGLRLGKVTAEIRQRRTA